MYLYFSMYSILCNNILIIIRYKSSSISTNACWKFDEAEGLFAESGSRIGIGPVLSDRI